MSRVSKFRFLRTSYKCIIYRLNSGIRSGVTKVSLVARSFRTTILSFGSAVFKFDGNWLSTPVTVVHILWYTLTAGLDTDTGLCQYSKSPKFIDWHAVLT